jgi:hypothetical protein
MLPQELGCGSGMTCWRRLRDWQQEGIWELMHFAHLRWLARDHTPSWTVARCARCWRYADRAESDRPRQARPQRHLICDGQGDPLAS